ncbi:thiol-disulfide isomerase and thioredoxin [Vibrio ishigakensis]|uniref:Thiol-disulfide isomerase and thioredoxin n=2 Tax=Vibrio ishigakensis TaxID=1481914 RepID=A0A0B8NSF4_9VIBR|nr:thiol-disulfide isomerase and thioredoxin [Vibrio ishigakensis]
MLVELGADVEVVDIAFDDELFSRYGVTIPVVNLNGEELNWPFTIETLNSWLEINGITNNS